MRLGSAGRCCGGVSAETVGARFYTAGGNRYNYILWGGTERPDNPGCFRSIPRDYCPLMHPHPQISDLSTRTTSASLSGPRPGRTATVSPCTQTFGAFRDVVDLQRLRYLLGINNPRCS